TCGAHDCTFRGIRSSTCSPSYRDGVTDGAVTEASVRDEFRDWLTAHWDAELTLQEWRERLADSGWARPSWPSQWYGRDLPAWSEQLVADELGAAGAVGPPLGSGMWLAAPTILEHGDNELKQRVLRPTMTGAGSDLAGLTTRAERDGDEWVVNGQKVWSTSAHYADFGMLLARTDRDAPKHAGITYFVLPMHQPGVEARPLRQMNGYASFNEVFLTDARVPDANRVGAPGAGWKVALTTLAHERSFGAVRRPRLERGTGRVVDEAATEADHFFETYRWYPQRAGRVDLVVDLARRVGRADDPVVRQ